MQRRAVLALGILALASLTLNAQQSQDEKKAPAPSTLKVKLNYTGSGTVDEKHKIYVFLFDSPDFVQGNVMPIATDSATAKDGTITFPNLDKSPVYVVSVYDPKGEYEAMSAPPSGASMGMYSKTPGQPEPVKLEPGQTAEITLAFDDTAKMP
jgi:hypothetical protein